MILGVIADDMTGASDVALTLSQGGLNVTQVVANTESFHQYQESDVVVAALKTRTAPVEEAVKLSLDACEKLLAAGARQVLLKICSTFDSTANGNIGPVADALRLRLGAGSTIVCPAFPENGRTVFKGYLFVGQQLLHESPMKDHPLTPMRDSSLVRLMSAQTRANVGLLSLDKVTEGAGSIRESLAAGDVAGVSYFIADAIANEHLVSLVEANEMRPLLVGGSGIAIGLPGIYRRLGLQTISRANRFRYRSRGRSAILAGSCSVATRGQIVKAIAAGFPTRKLDAVELDRNPSTIDEACAWALKQDAIKPVLIYASDAPEQVELVKRILGEPRASRVVENALGGIAKFLIANGFDRLIIAGGETSGAVIQATSLKALQVGPEIAPGVPWMYSAHTPELAIALKSGNFGNDDFLISAWEKLTSQESVN